MSYEQMFCQHGGDVDRCIVCNPETGDPNEWNETHHDEPISNPFEPINKYITESKDLLAEVLDVLGNMTTNQFSKGADKTLREKIAKFLDENR